MTPEEAALRAQRAQAFLKNPLWSESWDALQATLVAAMRNAKTAEGTLKAKDLLGLMVDLRQHWERAIKDGQIAEHQLKLDAEEKKRAFWRRIA